MAEGTPFFTVAINTRNRADMLGASLRAALEQDVSVPFEVLVVDNDSSDHTAELVANMQPEHPCLRYVHEPRLGVGSARYRAMREAWGEVVIFVDDDATLMPGYLALLHEVWVREQPDVVGGPIDIVWTDDEPSDWDAALTIFRGPFDGGTEPKRLHGGGYPEGCNIALRREAVMAVGNFDPEMGTCRPGTWAGEEIELCTRLDMAGYHLRYEPQLRVTHFQQHAGRSGRWLYHTAFERGRTQFHIWRRRFDGLRIRTVVGDFLREMLASAPWWRRALRVRACITFGCLYEAWHLWRNGTWTPGCPRITRPPSADYSSET